MRRSVTRFIILVYTKTETQTNEAMGAYLAWIARDYENRQEHLRRRSRELRGAANGGASTVHARLPGILAELQSGWEMWLQFALDVGAISNPEQAKLEQRGRTALAKVAAIQLSYHQASDPALRARVRPMLAPRCAGRSGNHKTHPRYRRYRDCPQYGRPGHPRIH
jgi:hypothetical protein